MNEKDKKVQHMMREEYGRSLKGCFWVVVVCGLVIAALIALMVC